MSDTNTPDPPMDLVKQCFNKWDHRFTQGVETPAGRVCPVCFPQAAEPPAEPEPEPTEPEPTDPEEGS